MYDPFFCLRKRDDPRSLGEGLPDGWNQYIPTRERVGGHRLRLWDGHPAKGLNELMAGWMEPLEVIEPSGRLISAK